MDNHLIQLGFNRSQSETMWNLCWWHACDSNIELIQKFKGEMKKVFEKTDFGI